MTNTIARDLLQVGQAAFLADRAFRRGQRLGQRTRQITVIVPVEEPRRWRNLGEIVGGWADFVTQDRWRFEFAPRGTKRIESRTKVALPNPSVNLFSGGLDSLCGAAAVFQRGETPIFVTHAPPGYHTVMARVDALKRRLGFAEAPRAFASFLFQVNEQVTEGERVLFPERSRRARPLLYLCMAGSIALEFRISKVRLSENGVLAVNLPFQPHLHGALVSRHAHPETLRRFDTLLRRLWPWSETPVVENLFMDCTKGEQLEVLRGALDFANGTVSCEYARQQVAFLIHWLKKRGRRWREIRECGLCFPCLVRRVALHYAGVPEPPGHYVFDARLTLRNPSAYSGFPLYDYVRPCASDLRDFALKLMQMSRRGFVLSFLPDISAVASFSDNFHRAAKEVYDVHQRFALQVIDYFRS